MKKQIAMLTALATLTMAVAPISVLADEEKVDIAVVSISEADSNNVRYIKGLEDGAEQYGYEVSVLDADGSTERQTQLLQILCHVVQMSLLTWYFRQLRLQQDLSQLRMQEFRL